MAQDLESCSVKDIMEMVLRKKRQNKENLDEVTDRIIEVENDQATQAKEVGVLNTKFQDLMKEIDELKRQLRKVDDQREEEQNNIAEREELLSMLRQKMHTLVQDQTDLAHMFDDPSAMMPTRQTSPPSPAFSHEGQTTTFSMKMPTPTSRGVTVPSILQPQSHPTNTASAPQKPQSLFPNHEDLVIAHEEHGDPRRREPKELTLRRSSSTICPRPTTTQLPMGPRSPAGGRPTNFLLREDCPCWLHFQAAQCTPNSALCKDNYSHDINVFERFTRHVIKHWGADRFRTECAGVEAHRDAAERDFEYGHRPHPRAHARLKFVCTEYLLRGSDGCASPCRLRNVHDLRLLALYRIIFGARKS